MLIATMHDALPIFGIAALLLAACCVPLGPALWILRGEAPRRRLGKVGRRVVAAVVAIAGLPLYAYAAPYLLIGIAAIGCAPDAYECPL
jgi:hypothetical protein